MMSGTSEDWALLTSLVHQEHASDFKYFASFIGLGVTASCNLTSHWVADRLQTKTDVLKGSADYLLSSISVSFFDGILSPMICLDNRIHYIGLHK
jgi:hypothetical protein